MKKIWKLVNSTKGIYPDKIPICGNTFGLAMRIQSNTKLFVYSSCRNLTAFPLRQFLFFTQFTHDITIVYFAIGSYTLGVPTDHSCVEKNINVINGRLICTKTKKDTVMCIPSCKTGLLLRTGYFSRSSDVSKFPIYMCRYGSLFWTDIKDRKIPLPNPRCLDKEDYLAEMISEDNS